MHISSTSSTSSIRTTERDMLLLATIARNALSSCLVDFYR
jgi:hypothetical protein